MNNDIRIIPKLIALASLCVVLVLTMLAFNLMQLKEAMLEERKGSIRQIVETTVSAIDYYSRSCIK